MPNVWANAGRYEGLWDSSSPRDLAAVEEDEAVGGLRLGRNHDCVAVGDVGVGEVSGGMYEFVIVFELVVGEGGAMSLVAVAIEEKVSCPVMWPVVLML